MASTSKAESSSWSASRSSRAKALTPRLTSVSTRNAGVPVSNQYAPNSRVSNSSRMSKGLYTRSSPRQLYPLYHSRIASRSRPSSSGANTVSTSASVYPQIAP